MVEVKDDKNVKDKAPDDAKQLVARAHGYVDGYMRALLESNVTDKAELLALVAAFASQKGGDGLAMVKRAYDIAVREEYRFYSYGDAMMIL